MRDYAKIYTAIWRSRKFSRLDSDDARYLYLYLHSCPHSNLIGCFPLPEGYALADLGWDSERYRKAMDSLSKAFLVGFDRAEMLVRIVDFIRHDPFTNPKHAAGAVKVAMSLPDCEEKQRLIEDLRGAKYVNLADLGPQNDSLSKAYRNPEPEPEPIPEPKKDGGGGSAGARETRNADQPPEDRGQGQTDREQLLEAMGVGPDGIAGPSRFLGTQGDMAEARRWLALPGLTVPVVCEEIRRIVTAKSDGPPSSFKYFTPAMQRLSGAISAGALAPEVQHHQARASPPRSNLDAISARLQAEFAAKEPRQ